MVCVHRTQAILPSCHPLHVQVLQIEHRHSRPGALFFPFPFLGPFNARHHVGCRSRTAISRCLLLLLSEALGMTISGGMT